MVFFKGALAGMDLIMDVKDILAPVSQIFILKCTGSDLVLQ